MKLTDLAVRNARPDKDSNKIKNFVTAKACISTFTPMAQNTGAFAKLLTAKKQLALWVFTRPSRLQKPGTPAMNIWQAWLKALIPCTHKNPK